MPPSSACSSTAFISSESALFLTRQKDFAPSAPILLFCSSLRQGLVAFAPRRDMRAFSLDIVACRFNRQRGIDFRASARNFAPSAPMRLYSGSYRQVPFSFRLRQRAWRRNLYTIASHAEFHQALIGFQRLARAAAPAVPILLFQRLSDTRVWFVFAPRRWPVRRRCRYYCLPDSSPAGSGGFGRCGNNFRPFRADIVAAQIRFLNVRWVFALQQELLRLQRRDCWWRFVPTRLDCLQCRGKRGGVALVKPRPPRSRLLMNRSSLSQEYRREFPSNTLFDAEKIDNAARYLALFNCTQSIIGGKQTHSF